MATASPREPALQLIVGYKLARAALSAVAGLTLVALVTAHLDSQLRLLATRLQEHATSRVGLLLAEGLQQALSASHVPMLIAALFFDAALVFLEGWGLHKRRWWATWLVVTSAAVLLPFEVAALARHFSALRATTLAVNVGIVAWLIGRRVRASAH